MKLFGVLVVTALLLISCGKKESLPVHGNWTTTILDRAGVKAVGKLKIESDRVTMTNECTDGGKTELATVSSSAKVTSTQIILEEDQSKGVRTASGATCSVSITKGTANYQVNGDTLTLSEGSIRTWKRQ